MLKGPLKGLQTACTVLRTPFQNRFKMFKRFCKALSCSKGLLQAPAPASGFNHSWCSSDPSLIPREDARLNFDDILWTTHNKNMLSFDQIHIGRKGQEKREGGEGEGGRGSRGGGPGRKLFPVSRFLFPRGSSATKETRGRSTWVLPQGKDP
jgi:hypothetical protein